MATIAEFLRGDNGANPLGNLLYPVASGPQTYNFLERVVQFDDDPNNVASGEASIIFSVPPVLATAAPFGLQNLMVPIGSVQGFSDNEVNNVQQFPEIGSRLKRTAFGMAQYQVQMSKVLTWHSNLRHALYAWIARMGAGGTDFALDFIRKPAEDSPQAGSSHFTTMESEIIRVPFGLLSFVMTAGGVLVSREYYEKCYIQNIGKAVQAGQGIIQENVSIICTRKVPCNSVNLTLNPDYKDFNIHLGNGDPLLGGNAPPADASTLP